MRPAIVFNIYLFRTCLLNAVALDYNHVAVDSEIREHGFKS